ncbi:hypothetical protein [Granulicella arctica]|uniref:hypothetical protein n=1 Tax=Granulicella arctica TaxID=940613 RepID=UPI0021DFE1D9|nr:hypothetical protein [Granulicella arctica]
MPYVIDAADFARYPPEAKKVASRNLVLLQQLPQIFAALLLSEIISYDWRFPAERADIDRQLRFLSGLSAAGLQASMTGFAGLSLSDAMREERWGAAPSDFIEKFTAYLWTVHQMDRFREAAKSYQEAMLLVKPEPSPAVPRLCVVIIGRDAAPGAVKLFQKLRPHGTYFTQVKQAGGVDELFTAVKARVSAHPASYAHWYVDGGEPVVKANAAGLQVISYETLAPVRTALLQKMKTAQNSGDVVGPESLRSLLANLRPDQLATSGASSDPVLQHFELSLLTEGSGTQIFSTTFVQWAGRELLRRARPLTLVLRYAPRQVDRPMNEMLVADGPGTKMKDDPAGSLIDADMGAYYTWINLMRLTGANRASFVVWFEDQREALAVGPTLARGVVSGTPCDLPQILKWVS